MTGVVKVKTRRARVVAVNLKARAAMVCNRKAGDIARFLALHEVLAAGHNSKGQAAK